jgi:hypothetical protein
MDGRPHTCVALPFRPRKYLSMSSPPPRLSGGAADVSATLALEKPLAEVLDWNVKEERRFGDLEVSESVTSVSGCEI